MKALVLVALRRPLTFVVLAITILLFGVISVFRTPVDIFPPIKLPIVAAIWTYTGLLPSDMSGLVILILLGFRGSSALCVDHAAIRTRCRSRSKLARP